MLNLTHRYTDALLAYAEESGLEKIYRQALMFVVNDLTIEKAPEEIRNFLVQITGTRENVLSVLYAFLDAARKKMNIIDAEVFSAVPLTNEQFGALEVKLARVLGKQVEITNTVDPSLLGGIRVIADNMVIDDTIKRKIQEMKKNITEGVAQKE